MKYEGSETLNHPMVLEFRSVKETESTLLDLDNQKRHKRFVFKLQKGVKARK